METFLKNAVAIFTIFAVCYEIILLSQIRDNTRNNYWENQMEICGKVGWYEFQGTCIPVPAVGEIK